MSSILSRSDPSDCSFASFRFSPTCWRLFLGELLVLREQDQGFSGRKSGVERMTGLGPLQERLERCRIACDSESRQGGDRQLVIVRWLGKPGLDQGNGVFLSVLA